VIRVNDLHKRYGKTEALRGVSFALGPGITGLLGPNGAGKTTLLRCMLGVIRPTAGDVDFADGMRVRQQEVGYLPQKYGLFKELTVRESLAYFGVLKGIPHSQIPDEVDECLRRVNMLDSRARRVGALSGGMIRRVGIASALLGGPCILVFDEPTAGLDPEERVRFKRLASELGKVQTVLLSTHIVEDIEAIASTVIVLNEGRVAASGALQDIAELARGKCYVAPQRAVNDYSEDYYIEKYLEIDGEPVARLLSAKYLDGFTPVEPTVEDGYLCATRGIA